MWSQTVLAMLGVWLMLSPFIFRHPDLWLHDVVVGAGIMVFSLASIWKKADFLRIFVAVLAMWLMIYGYMASDHPRAPASQNHIFVGLLIAMFVIIPRWNNRPPDIMAHQ